MTATTATIGLCARCGHEAAKTKMAAHLAACVEGPGGSDPSQVHRLYRFEAADDARYWLYVEARADASLRHLDTFLRKIWLECCGHLSAFYADRSELAMSSAASVAFGTPATKIRYEYDFGSTTALIGQATGSRHGMKDRAVVRLAARNAPLEEPCARCTAPATVVCPYCLDDGEALFCAAHAATHEHADEEVYLPVVNSPRMGVCGYRG